MAFILDDNLIGNKRVIDEFLRLDERLVLSTPRPSLAPSMWTRPEWDDPAQQNAD